MLKYLLIYSIKETIDLVTAEMWMSAENIKAKWIAKNFSSSDHQESHKSNIARFVVGAFPWCTNKASLCGSLLWDTLLLSQEYSVFHSAHGTLPRSTVIFTLSICFTVNSLTSHTHTDTEWKALSAGLRCHGPHCSTGGGTLGVHQANKGRRERTGPVRDCHIMVYLNFIFGHIYHLSFFFLSNSAGTF